MDLLAALLQQVLFSEDGSVPLHSLLESTSDLGSGVLTVGKSHLVELGDGFLTSVRGKLLLSLSRNALLLSSLSSSSTEDNEI